MRRTLYETEHEAFRESFRRFLQVEFVPHLDEWDAAGIVAREFYAAAGKSGFLAMDAPEEFGGGGVPDFRFNAVIMEEIMRTGAAGAGLGITLHNDVCLPYFLEYCSEEQKARWLPGIASGELITAIAMTEPGAGSDLAGIATTARRDGDVYVVNGAKTFITNGINADLVIVAARTSDDPHAGLSLMVVERGMDGFERGKQIEKLGQHCSDTSELFFEDVHVPAENLLGPEGSGFGQLVARLVPERLILAVGALASAEAAFEITLDYVKERKAFGQPVGSFQHNKFKMAELQTKLEVTQAYVDDCVIAHTKGELTAVDAAKAKWWSAQVQNDVLDECVQLYGGYGYMNEYRVARAWRDARVTKIWAGSNEIMKELIGRDLGL